MVKMKENSYASDQQALANQIIVEFMREQKRKRFFGWIRLVLILILIALIFYQCSDYRSDNKGLAGKPHIGLIDIYGRIFDSANANSENFARGLEAAYKNPGLKALIIRINSSGGSPVQANYMYNSLQYYREKYPTIKTYAVCVDICASAAYYIASAAEAIYADPSSIVGSIGVAYNGFGFVPLMQKVGITRRLHTAGKHKGFLDPFSEESPEEVVKLQSMLEIIHQQFIAKVKKGRGSRIKIDDEAFFWTFLDRRTGERKGSN